MSTITVGKKFKSKEIGAYLGTDSIAYLTLDNLERAIDAPGAGFCSACLTGDYPVEISPAPAKEVLEVAIRA